MDERIVFEAVVPEGRVVVKVDRDGDRSAREVAALRVARSGGLPVQRVVFAEHGARSIVVVQRLDGQPVRLKDRGWAAAVGRALRTLHDMPAPSELRMIAGNSGWWSHQLQWADLERERHLDLGVLSADLVHRLHAAVVGTFRGLPELDGGPEYPFKLGDAGRTATLQGQRPEPDDDCHKGSFCVEGVILRAIPRPGYR